MPSKKKSENPKTDQQNSDVVSEEFSRIIVDLISDVKTAFPEYNGFIAKWWKEPEYFLHIVDEQARAITYETEKKKSIAFLYKFCQKKFPPRFFDILYQNESIFDEESDIDTEFLPQIHFRNMIQSNISDSTRETIWKYLKLIMFTIVGSISDKEAFGDTAKLFEAVNEDEFKEKLTSTLDDIQKAFESSDHPGPNIPNAENLHEHISGMLDGKLGKLAYEIAEEAAGELNLDLEDSGNDPKEVFQKLIKNPGKMMNLVKSVGTKLDTKIKSGELKESELIAEASEMMKRMKDMPGMGGIQEMMSKMGMGNFKMPPGAKMDFNGMEAALNRNMKMAKTKERIQKKSEESKKMKEAQAAVDALKNNSVAVEESKKHEAELLEMFSKEKEKPKKKKGKK
jgi:hypothetical protein